MELQKTMTIKVKELTRAALRIHGANRSAELGKSMSNDDIIFDLLQTANPAAIRAAQEAVNKGKASGNGNRGLDSE